MRTLEGITEVMLKAHDELSEEATERIYKKLNLIDDLCIRADGHLCSRQVIATVIAEELLKEDS